MKIRLGEPVFTSIQGEYLRTGNLSIWQRYFGCSLRCGGFFQPDPTNPATYIDPLNGIDPKKYKTVFELPVVEYGCDSIYSIDPRFKHCATDYASPADLVKDIRALLPNGKFIHPKTQQTYDFCITGGEPMMHQDKTIAIYEEMYAQDSFPYDIQFETNCTRELTPELISLIKETSRGRMLGKTNWHFSMSPKLFTVSGEPSERAWFPNIIKQYYDVSESCWLKFVVNNTEAAWEELNSKVKELHELGVYCPISIMPVGATKEQQEDSSVIAEIATRAIKEGYHVSGRIHATIFGNKAAT